MNKQGQVLLIAIISLVVFLGSVVAGAEQPIQVTVDATSPSISITSPANNSNTTDIHLEIKYTVSDTNLDSCWWTKDSGTTNTSITCGTNITGQTWTEGIKNVQIYANDTLGNMAFSSVSFRVDTTPPVTTATMTSPLGGASYSNGTWTKNDIRVALSTVDPGGDFNPISYPVYCTDTTNTCSPSTFYAPNVDISTEGTSYIRYSATDLLGNAETIKSRTLKIDKTPPTTTITMTSPPGGATYTNGTLTNQNVRFTLSSFDSGIGFDNLAYPKYCIDTTNTCTPSIYYVPNVDISTIGISYVRYQSVDLLGNVELIQSKTINIAPDLTLTPSPSTLNFGTLGPGMSAEKAVTLTPGTSNLDVSVSITGNTLMQSIQTNRTGSWTNLTGDSFVVSASTPFSFGAKLTIPSGTTSSTYSGTIVYTVLEHV